MGCGNKKYKSKNPEDIVIGLDNVKLPGVDKVHDLEKKKLPFKKNEFDIIILNHILEHIKNFHELIAEIHRIAKPNAIIKIKTPFYSSWGQFADITHVRFFSWKTFDYFQENYPYKYYKKTKPTFNVLKKRIIFGVYDSPTRFLNWLINPIVNTFPRFYMRFFAWSIPCEELQFELEVIKK